MKTPIFTGASAALVTPFKDGKIDYEAEARLLDMQIDAGSEAVTVAGTTGEAATLSEREYCELLSFVRRYIGSKMKLIAGCGSNNTAAVIEKAEMAELCGADGLLIVTPYYNKTTQDGLFRHYDAIAKNTDLPIIMYNVPSRTGMSFTADTYKRLSEIDNINGVKEASGNFDLIGKTVSLCGDDLNIWSGNDDQTIEIMALGGVGVISVAANIVPKVMMDITDMCDDNDYASARKLFSYYHELFDTMFCLINPIPIKEMLSVAGICTPDLRLPLVRGDIAFQRKIHALMKKYRMI